MDLEITFIETNAFSGVMGMVSYESYPPFVLLVPLREKKKLVVSESKDSGGEKDAGEAKRSSNSGSRVHHDAESSGEKTLGEKISA